MPRLKKLELLAVDLPFRKPFKHAAAERTSSSSLFLKCVTDSDQVGFGEALPRKYVTGESRESAFELLNHDVLPHLFDVSFDSFDQVSDFLWSCNGKAPAEWVHPDQPQTAAWCTVDLALLDTFGRVFQQQIQFGDANISPTNVCCSAVIPSDVSPKTLLLIRLARVRQVKLKLDEDNCVEAAQRCRKFLGSQFEIRADVNMGWTVDQAIENMAQLSHLGIRSFEQPIAADDLAGLSRLVRECPDLDVMVDESLNDAASLETLIAQQACTAVNVRISKCGGLVAAYRRCTEALQAGLKLQIGCQVGESSLLSAAQLFLIRALPTVHYLEGCFGRHLLKEDPGSPILQFGFGGKRPKLPTESGLGIRLDEAILNRWTVRKETLSA